MDVQRVLAAIAEPTRFRIVQLLSSGARTVGEVAAELGALQPQTTKHLQTMEAAGVIAIHRLGRRRVVSLQGEVLRGLGGTLGALAEAIPEEPTLGRYESAIAAEEARLAGVGSTARIIRFVLNIPASPSQVWRAWTDPDIVRRWWSPEHFEVVVCDVAPRADAPMRIVLREGDGAEYLAVGKVLTARPDREFSFELAPVDSAHRPLFAATYAVRFEGDASTDLTLEIHVSDVRPEAASAVAGLEVGWPQLLAQLSEVVQPG